jgi:hypothetical protein
MWSPGTFLEIYTFGTVHRRWHQSQHLSFLGVRIERAQLSHRRRIQLQKSCGRPNRNRILDNSTMESIDRGDQCTDPSQNTDHKWLVFCSSSFKSHRVAYCVATTENRSLTNLVWYCKNSIAVNERREGRSMSTAWDTTLRMAMILFARISLTFKISASMRSSPCETTSALE